MASQVIAKLIAYEERRKAQADAARVASESEGQVPAKPHCWSGLASTAFEIFSAEIR